MTSDPGETHSSSLSPASAPASPDTASQGSLFASLILNVILPVTILNRLNSVLDVSPWTVLAVALCFPFSGAVWEWRQRGKPSPLAALGALNVIGTGSLAGLGLGGTWFALKEAFFPLLIGIGVFASAFFKRPFAELIFLNPALFNVAAIRQALTRGNTSSQLRRSMKTATFALAGSFFLSALLNFGLAVTIFEPISEALNEAERANLLNEQVARMTWMGFAVIALPSTVCTAAIFWTVLKSLRRITGLKDEDLFAPSSSAPGKGR